MEAYEFYRDVLKIQDEALIRSLLPVTRVRRLARREILARESEVPREIGFVLGGCLCGFSQNSEGEEVVTCFCCHTGDTTMPSFSLTEPAVASMMALTDSEVLCLPTDLVAQLVQSSFVCLQLYNTLLEQSLRRAVKMQMVIYRGSAMERYRWFLQEYPGLVETINNKYIASFLQMTNVTLSRLRRTVREQDTVRPQPDAGRTAAE